MSRSSYKGTLQNAFLSEGFDSKHRNMQLKMVYTWGVVISLDKDSMGSQVQEGFQGQLCDSSRTWALSTFPLPVSAYGEPFRTSRGHHGPTAPTGRGQTSRIPTPPQSLLSVIGKELPIAAAAWEGRPPLRRKRKGGAPGQTQSVRCNFRSARSVAAIPVRARDDAVVPAPLLQLWKSLLWGLPFQGRNPALNPGP